ncbi:MAG: Protoheme IX farnesyltransferase [Candidatus Moanabacter tarae]|uniref:Protoheme IX farnesyltransferase n=1 Tax=Candidatus Moanibacter tarae TaxID=2200854 RepID=A0A2Z4AP27_9BACT|nr:MAG: Protoheme IX farnesyltransferase [Candidatus Moanabacter tarae]|tara:strand:- start:38940 stop:39881 length:942 start_codon:yes stop_codon:yes gene_type:complete
MTERPCRYQFEAETRTPVVSSSIVASKSTALEFWELTKPRLSLLAVITAIVGYLTALPNREPIVLVALIFGTSLAAGGVGALNQFMEREADSRMARTRGRPIPSGSLTPDTALFFGLILCGAGNIALWLCVNQLSALLAVLTQITYLLAYTPLKKRTPWCTHVGAIPGSIPPLIGWAAAEGTISTLGWILFSILLFWQIPHFMAIAWTYRDDYSRAGFPIASVTDPTGTVVSLQSLVTTILLVTCSLLPTALQFTSIFYSIIAIISGIWFLYYSICFLSRNNRDRAARRLFIVSIAYLPILLGALVVDRIFLI